MGSRNLLLLACVLHLLLPVGAGATGSEGEFVAFESGQVRPVALSPDGSRLFVLNTPDGHLEVFHLGRGAPRHMESIPVGLEPVAVAARSSHEVWVVNHLSDSVSVVRVVPGRSRVVRTLQVGDEPNDIVFAGSPHRPRAFVTTAHRGQNSPYPRGEYATPGIGRADVWVFDAREASRGAESPLAILTLFGDKPRALAASPDGLRVYAAPFRSGNRTTTVAAGVVCDGGASSAPCEVRGTTYPGGMPAPNTNAAGIPAPETGLIVEYDPEIRQWRDEVGRDWSAAVRFDLPDLDLFEIDATADPPREARALAGLGTVLYGIAVNPRSGTIYVSNTEARNEVRFEGPGELAGTRKPLGVPASVRGRLHQARITVVKEGGVFPRHLNPHIDYDEFPAPPEVRERSVSLPLGMVVSGDGDLLYVAALGSDRVAVYDTAVLEEVAVDASPRDLLPVEGGPTGLALDERRERLYVLARFDNSLVTLDLASGRELDRIPLHNPEPAPVVEGRRFLYDARLTSSNGEASCGVCHVFGDVDDLAWDLGNPDADVEPNPNPGLAGESSGSFHPMKGPMTTQTLRGMSTHGPMHWRGDRTGGNAVPPGDPLDEKLAFEAFNVAFEGLLGREGPLSASDMSDFADFALAITPPPNPIRRLDGRLRDDEARGRTVFLETSTFPGEAEHCQDCHTFDADAGFFGTNGLSGEAIKVPQLRTLYQKVGMFGFPQLGEIFGVDPFLGRVDHSHQGPQIRGFGYRHDGSVDRVRSFVSQLTFLLDEEQVRDTEAFLMAADAELAPIVGQQVTLSGGVSRAALARVRLLMERAATPRVFRQAPATECDLVVKGRIRNRARGFVWNPGRGFVSDRERERPWSLEELLALGGRRGESLTFTCVPPGSGRRVGIDRDRDGALDGDEHAAGSDPADPTSRPYLGPPG